MRSFFILFASSIVLGACSSGGPSISVLPTTDDFTQSGSEISVKMDILWVVDNSGSMKPYQDQLKAHFNSFITNFVGKGYDFRMAVIGTDAWMTGKVGFNYANQSGTNVNAAFDIAAGSGWECYPDETISSNFLDGYVNTSGYDIITSSDTSIDFTLTPDGSDPDSSDDIETIFSKNIELGVRGCAYESGLESLKIALENPANGSFNFPRQDAHLAIIVISDEEDYTNSSYTPNNSLSYYHSFLTGVASPDYGYSFHTLAVLDETDPNCLDGMGSSILHPAASESTRYPEFSALTNGITASVCSPFAETLQNIAVTIIEKTVEFKLDQTPTDPNTLTVSIKNPSDADFTVLANSSTNGWTYSSSQNSILFHGTGIPEAGASIKIFYEPDSL